jgi:hypothetical protein
VLLLKVMIALRCSIANVGEIILNGTDLTVF